MAGRAPEFIKTDITPEVHKPYKGGLVITGIALRTIAGGIEETKRVVYRGENTAIDMGIDNPRTRIGAPFPDDYDPSKELHKDDDTTGLSKMAIIGMVEGRNALGMAGLLSDDKRKINTNIYHPRRFSPIFGSGYSTAAIAVEIEKIRQEKGARWIPMNLALAMFPEQANARIAMALGLKGYPISNYGACAASGMSLDYAVRVIKQGLADAALVNASETVTGTHRDLVNGAFGSFRNAMSKRNDEPTRASRPYDRDRDGFVPADGHATVVVEREDLAEARGANILARIDRTHSSIDGFKITEADPEEVANMIRTMLYVPRLRKTILPDAFLTHATGTPLGDRVEIEAYLKVFGNTIKDHGIPLTALKSILNHSLGASGLVTVVMGVISLQEGWFPPTANLEHIQADPTNPNNRLFDDLNIPTKKPLAVRPKRIFWLASGFGGYNGGGLLGAP